MKRPSLDLTRHWSSASGSAFPSHHRLMITPSDLQVSPLVSAERPWTAKVARPWDAGDAWVIAPHDLIVDVVARMAQTANAHVPHPARDRRPHARARAEAASLAYSPNWRHDLTSLDAERDGNQMIANATCPSVVTKTSTAHAADCCRRHCH